MSMCALFILILVLFSVFFRGMANGSTNRTFITTLIVSILFVLCDFITLLTSRETVPMWLQHTALWGSMLAYSLIPLCYNIYMTSLMDIWHLLFSSRKLQMGILVPWVFLAFAFIANIFNGFMFTLDETGLWYHKGIYLILVYSIVVLAFSLYLLFKYKALIDIKKRVSICVLFIATLIALTINLINPSLNFISLVLALGLLQVTLVIQRPEERLDIVTGMERNSAYMHDMRGVFISKKQVKYIMIDIANYMTLKTILDYETRNMFIKNIGKDITNICKERHRKLGVPRFYYVNDGRFRIVLSDVTDSEIIKLAEDLSIYFKRLFEIKQVDLNLLVYICIVDCLKDLGDIRSLYRFETNLSKTLPHTAEVLYATELMVKNKFNYSDSINDIIENALENKLFEVYYQPIYSVEKRKFISAEALIRLIDKEYGFISPEIFIPAAEKSGAIYKIGDFVLDEVFEFIASPEFKELGLDYIEINLSVIQCMQVELADNIINKMKKWQIRPNQVNLEITETAISYTQEVMENNLHKLAQYGVSFSLDDYGTGYSNIKRLTQLPLKLVKFDKTFANELENPKMRIILENTVNMMKAMKMEIVVEGVETEQMLQKFEELNCELVQGYYFSKPIPKKEFIDFLRAKCSE